MKKLRFEKRSALRKMKEVLTVVCICMLVTAVFANVPVKGETQGITVTFGELNDDSVFVKQRASGECTLAAATMLVRRAALLAGNPAWSSITDNTVRSVAWAPGLYWNFTVSGITVTHKSLSGTGELIQMLASHPEGIVIYDTGYPHAILVTDYTDGVFYCSDPANCCPVGRYPISYSLIRAERATACWYVTTALAAAVVRDDLVYQSGGLEYQIDPEDTESVICSGSTKNKKKVVIPDVVSIDGKQYEVSEVSEEAFSGNSSLKKLTIGANVTKIDKQAFYKCKKLSSVHIDSEELEEIGQEAFANISNKAQISVNSMVHKDLLLKSSLDAGVEILVNQQAESEMVSYSSKRM